MTELADDVGVQHPTMSRTLARMERDGLIERRIDPEDARANRIFLTAHARSLEPQLRAAAESVNANFLGPLSPKDRTSLIEFLDDVIEAVENPQSEN